MLNLCILEAETLGNNLDSIGLYTFPIPSKDRKHFYVLYIIMLIIIIISIIILNWLTTLVLFFVALFVILIIEIDSRIFVPTEVQLSYGSILIKYRNNKLINKQWSEVQWLNLWPGSTGCHAYAGVKFDDNTQHAIPLRYEDGRKFKEIYIKIIGTKPLNYEEFLKATNSMRWYSCGPSE